MDVSVEVFGAASTSSMPVGEVGEQAVGSTHVADVSPTEIAMVAARRLT